MKGPLRNCIAIALCFLFITNCRKHDISNPCQGKIQPTANFDIRETVGDTTFSADTVFRNNYIQFSALSNYDSVSWKIGDDSRTFLKPYFVLAFPNDITSIAVQFTGYAKPSSCFPNDKGTYTGTKQLTTVEQFDRATLTRSPLIGKYRGYFVGNPTDTFTVKIDYFDSTKYNTSVTGTQNFYWISNIPKGYIDSTSDFGLRYPELRHGCRVRMGYKSLVFDGSFDIHGSGWLSHDSLFINYLQNAQVAIRKKFIGKRY